MKKLQSVSVKTDLKTQNELFSLMKILFPICRSITGNGVRQSLQILQNHILLNISEDHLIRHKTMEEYAYQKSKIFFYQKKSIFPPNFCFIESFQL